MNLKHYLKKMSVCRTCLLYLANEPKYLICNPLQSNVQNSEPNSQSKRLQLRTMLEKCMPEMVKPLKT